MSVKRSVSHYPQGTETITGNVTVNGTVTGTRFIAGDGSAGAPGFSFAGDQGIYSEAAGYISFATGGVRYARLSAAYLELLSARLSTPRLEIAGDAAQAIGANTDNLTLGSTTGGFRFNPSGAFNLTGINGGSDGRVLFLQNESAANTLTLVHDATSTAANRFLCPGGVNFALGPTEGVFAIYDSTNTRWRIMAF